MLYSKEFASQVKHNGQRDRNEPTKTRSEYLQFRVKRDTDTCVDVSMLPDFWPYKCTDVSYVRKSKLETCFVHFTHGLHSSSLVSFMLRRHTLQKNKTKELLFKLSGGHHHVFSSTSEHVFLCIPITEATMYRSLCALWPKSLCQGFLCCACVCASKALFAFNLDTTHTHTNTRVSCYTSDVYILLEFTGIIDIMSRLHRTSTTTICTQKAVKNLHL